VIVNSDPAALRILAVEDNVANQFVLRVLLAESALGATMASDGVAALSAWETGEWDLILMDIQMPRLDGVGATREIRRRERMTGRRRTPILAVTADTDPLHAEEYFRAGMDGVVPKPIEVSRLFAAINVAIQAEPELILANG